MDGKMREIINYYNFTSFITNYLIKLIYKYCINTKLFLFQLY